jgi:hypothetical protein
MPRNARIYGGAVMGTDPAGVAVPTFDNTFRMRLRDLFRWRRDVRRFRTEPVSQAVMDDYPRTGAIPDTMIAVDLGELTP